MDSKKIHVFYKKNNKIESVVYGIYPNFNEAYTDLMFLQDMLETTGEIKDYIFSPNMPDKMRQEFIECSMKNNKKVAIII